jgi:protein SCO1
MTKLYAGLAAGAVAALLGGSAWYVLTNRGDDQFAECRQGQVAGGDIGGPFTLVDTTGKTVTDAEVLAKPALVYFGYTFCPDVCPFDMSRNVEAVDLLDEKGIDVTPVFISIDPERDTPEALADYAFNMHPYKTFYARRETGDEFYLMDHSTFTYLMLPGIGFVDFYRREITSDRMAESVACFVGAGKAAT